MLNLCVGCDVADTDWAVDCEKHLRNMALCADELEMCLIRWSIVSVH